MYVIYVQCTVYIVHEVELETGVKKNANKDYLHIYK